MQSKKHLIMIEEVKKNKDSIYNRIIFFIESIKSRCSMASIPI